MYQAAALMASQSRSVPALAAGLMTQAKARSVGSGNGVPNHEFENVALDYCRARAWQFCMLLVDPTLPEVQPRWT